MPMAQITLFNFKTTSPTVRFKRKKSGEAKSALNISSRKIQHGKSSHSHTASARSAKKIL